MGCWFVCRHEPSGDHEAWIQAARATLARQGHPHTVELRTATHTVLASEPVHPHHGNIFRNGDDFVAVAGTLFYRRQIGTAALSKLLEDFVSPFDRWEDVHGQFGAVVAKQGALHIFGDYFGAFNIFEATDGRFVSTSFLTLARVLERLTVVPQSVYEFAFTEAVLGDATFFEQIRKLGARRQLTLGARRIEHVTPKQLPAGASPRSTNELLHDHESLLSDVGAMLADTFGSKIQCPLSGGYDSRLLLAMLRRSGVKPHVYVYGGAHSREVAISQEIGRREGFSVEHINKSRHATVTPSEFPALVEQDFEMIDGFASDGSMLDNGGNAHARAQRQAGGALTTSGGGGEIYRNFFMIGSGRYRLSDIVNCFYNRFTPKTLTSRFDRTAYDQAIAGKMSEALGGASGRLDRAIIDQLYPMFRCPSFFGRELSIVGRYGAYFLPFLELKVVRAALELPRPLRDPGLFEAHLIAALDPKLAAHPSSYGHSFVETPGPRARLRSRLVMMRPMWVRRQSYVIKSSLKHQTDGHGGLLDPAFLKTVIDIEYPAMRRYFHPERFNSDGLTRRVAMMEYMMERLGSKVRLD